MSNATTTVSDQGSVTKPAVYRTGRLTVEMILDPVLSELSLSKLSIEMKILARKLQAAAVVQTEADMASVPEVEVFVSDEHEGAIRKVNFVLPGKRYAIARKGESIIEVQARVRDYDLMSVDLAVNDSFAWSDSLPPALPVTEPGEEWSALM